MWREECRKKKAFVGSVQELWLGCKNGHPVKWCSSAKVNHVYAKNWQAMASISLSGDLYATILFMTKFLNLKIPTEFLSNCKAVHYSHDKLLVE